MSIDAYLFVKNMVTPGPLTKLVLCHFASEMSGTDSLGCIDVPTLAKFCCVGEMQVIEAIETLVSGGFLQRLGPPNLYKVANFRHPPAEPQRNSIATKRRPLSASVRATVWARDSLTCVECGATENLTVDHIMPLVKGGSNELDNLQTLCLPCNVRKGPRTP